MTDLHLVGGWNTQAIWKICDHQNGFIFPKDRGEHEKYLSCHHLGRGWKVAKKKSCIYSLVFLEMIQKSSNSNSPLRWCPVQPFYQWQFRAALTTRKLCMLKNVHPHKHTPRSDQYILKVACIFFWYWRASKIHPKKTYSCHCMDGIGSPGYKKKKPFKQLGLQVVSTLRVQFPSCLPRTLLVHRRWLKMGEFLGGWVTCWWGCILGRWGRVKPGDIRFKWHFFPKWLQ